MNYRKEIIDCINRVYKNGLTTTSGGNLSMRDEENNIYITPSGKDKGTLEEKDIVKVEKNGTIIGLKPSIELPFHSLIFKLRPELNAVLHVHSPFLVSYSLLNLAPNTKILPQIFTKCGKIGLSLYDIPGSIDLGKQISKFIEDGCDMVMMQNHGVVVVAKDMKKAYEMLESLEDCAKICLYSKILGKTPNELSDKQLNLYSKAMQFDSTIDKVGTEEFAIREQMVKFSKRCYAHKFFAVGEGEISCKLSENEFLITPQVFDRADLKIEDIVKMKNGKAIGGTPSNNFNVHSKIYKNKEYVNSIFSASSPFIMSYGVTKEEINSRTIPESYIMMRDINRYEYGIEINDLNKLVKGFSLARPVALIENHCVITTGENIVKAFDRLEVSEITAKNLILSKILGVATNISDYEIEKIDKAFNLPLE